MAAAQATPAAGAEMPLYRVVRAASGSWQSRALNSGEPGWQGGGPHGAGLRVLVVAGDAPVRNLLARLLSSCAGTGGVRTVPDAARALGLLARVVVDVVFVQVELRGVDGFELARLVGRLAPPPAVVFVTDDASRALEAFDLGAIDFVPTTVGTDRLARSLGRVPLAGWRAGEEPAHAPQPASPGALAAGPEGASVPAAEVRWVEAVGGDHVRMHTAGGPWLVKGQLGLVSAWSGQGLVQIHRSYAVQAAAVSELRRVGRGLWVVVDGRELPVSRRREPRVRELLRGVGIVSRPSVGCD